jgi:hypothetical protein
MGRDDLKSDAEPGGFVEYGKEQLPKVDSMRRDKSQPDFYGVPILHDQDVMFTRASELGEKPASCYTCQFQQSNLTCGLLGPEISVRKVVGHRESGDPIEYWPCCGMHDYGSQAQGQPSYREPLSTPDAVGLIWINAPEVGQKFGGANCGGVNGGDDCDHYMVPSGDKWENPQGVCRVLQHTVDAGDVCTVWRDDDILDWEEAQQLMRGDSKETIGKRRMVKQIMGRE